ncbi:hypothetical protein T01_3463 [Trichinella spiralis]|uniref:Uncharacterized protein n=2 Tax=Trichinella spiralis TaxID=6334 RepID=A0A0V1AT60_TRISP|nr:hypothetical protein T01_3463 [Trichinella spiralis]
MIDDFVTFNRNFLEHLEQFSSFVGFFVPNMEPILIAIVSITVILTFIFLVYRYGAGEQALECFLFRKVNEDVTQINGLKKRDLKQSVKISKRKKGRKEKSRKRGKIYNIVEKRYRHLKRGKSRHDGVLKSSVDRDDSSVETEISEKLPSFEENKDKIAQKKQKRRTNFNNTDESDGTDAQQFECMQMIRQCKNLKFTEDEQNEIMDLLGHGGILKKLDETLADKQKLQSQLNEKVKLLKSERSTVGEMRKNLEATKSELKEMRTKQAQNEILLAQQSRDAKLKNEAALKKQLSRAMQLERELAAYAKEKEDLLHGVKRQKQRLDEQEKKIGQLLMDVRNREEQLLRNERSRRDAECRLNALQADFEKCLAMKRKLQSCIANSQIPILANVLRMEQETTNPSSLSDWTAVELSFQSLIQLAKQNSELMSLIEKQRNDYELTISGMKQQLDNCNAERMLELQSEKAAKQIMEDRIRDLQKILTATQNKLDDSEMMISTLLKQIIELEKEQTAIKQAAAISKLSTKEAQTVDMSVQTVQVTSNKNMVVNGSKFHHSDNANQAGIKNVNPINGLCENYVEEGKISNKLNGYNDVKCTPEMCSKQSVVVAADEFDVVLLRQIFDHLKAMEIKYKNCWEENTAESEHDQALSYWLNFLKMMEAHMDRCHKRIDELENDCKRMNLKNKDLREKNYALSDCVHISEKNLQQTVHLMKCNFDDKLKQNLELTKKCFSYFHPDVVFPQFPDFESFFDWAKANCKNSDKFAAASAGKEHPIYNKDLVKLLSETEDFLFNLEMRLKSK